MKGFPAAAEQTATGRRRFERDLAVVRRMLTRELGWRPSRVEGWRLVLAAAAGFAAGQLLRERWRRAG